MGAADKIINEIVVQTSAEQIDDLLEQLGMADLGSPFSPEEQFFHTVMEDNSGKRAGLMHHLRIQLGIFEFMGREKNYKTVIFKPSGVHYDIAKFEYTRSLLEWYFLSVHFNRFHEDYFIGSTLMRKCDMNKTLDLFMEHDDIKQAIKGKFTF